MGLIKFQLNRSSPSVCNPTTRSSFCDEEDPNLKDNSLGPNSDQVKVDNENAFHQISQEVFHLLKDLRTKNHNIIIIGNLNINSISNKFDAFDVSMGYRRDVW